MLFSVVVLGLIGGALAQCGTAATTCTLSTPCLCFPGAATCQPQAIDSDGALPVQVSSITYSSGVQFPEGLRIFVIAGNTLTINQGVTLQFCIPSSNSYLPSSSVIAAAGATVNLNGNIVFNVGNVVPSSLLFVGAGTLNGIIESMSAPAKSNALTSAAPCFTSNAAPTYATTSVTVTFTQSNSGAAGCVPVSTGLSGGAIAGIVIGSVVGAALLVVLAIFLFKKLDFDSKRQLFSRTKIHAAESSVPM